MIVLTRAASPYGLLACLPVRTRLPASFRLRDGSPEADCYAFFVYSRLWDMIAMSAFGLHSCYFWHNICFRNERLALDQLEKEESMKKYSIPVIAAGIALVGMLMSPTANAEFHFGVSFGFSDEFYYGGQAAGWHGEFSFETALDGYGYWEYIPIHGRIWIPYVNTNWQPYYYGYWIWSTYGWTWIPYEPWGWLPHHYGRWMWDAYYGWIWIPGYTWGAAWVSWHISGSYVGWAPMPPDHYYYSHSRSYSDHSRRWDRNEPSRVNWPHDVDYAGWVFVSPKEFTSDQLSNHIRQRKDIQDSLRMDTDLNMSKAPAREFIERAANRRIPISNLTTKEVNVGNRQLNLVLPKDQLDRIRTNAPKVRTRFMKAAEPGRNGRLNERETTPPKRPPRMDPAKSSDEKPEHKPVHLSRDRKNTGIHERIDVAEQIGLDHPAREAPAHEKIVGHGEDVEDVDRHDGGQRDGEGPDDALKEHFTPGVEGHGDDGIRKGDAEYGSPYGGGNDDPREGEHEESVKEKPRDGPHVAQHQLTDGLKNEHHA